jgi:hypothetical protein
MNVPSLLRTGGLLVLVGVAACGDATPVTPTPNLTPSFSSSAAASSDSDERVSVSAVLSAMNNQLAARGSNARILKAELIMDGKTWNGATSTIVLANDRFRGIGAEWVKGDPRRGERAGVSYAVASHLLSPVRVRPFTRDPNGANVRQVPVNDLDAQIEEAMTAWRNRKCSSAPIARVRDQNVGTNPDIIDDLLFGVAIGGPWARPADIVQSGWMHPLFFRLLFPKPKDANPEDPEPGDFILGVTLTLGFVDNNGTPNNPDDDRFTDIDRNGKADIWFSEIYHNARFFWGNTAALNVVDFYSVIAHETGHALGLGHFGKLFVTKKDAVDGGGISLSEIKFAPYALMNAAYVGGRNEIAGTDNSSFCQLWASKAPRNVR